MRWLIITMGLLLTACSENGPAPVADAAVQPVKLHLVTHTQDTKSRRFPAVVEAAQVAQLAFRVAGEVREFPVKPGNKVERGDLIAKLDPTDYQLVVDQAAARYKLAEAQFKRTQNLVDQGVISQQQFDEVKSNLGVARANLETAKANLSYTELRAPFAGTIAHVYVERFETVQPQLPIATLQLSNAIDVSIRVPENLFARVQRNTDYRPTVIFTAAPKQSFTAQLKEWDSTADPATNTYRVVFTMPMPSGINLLPGMSATVVVDVDAISAAVESGFVVPTAAVFSPATEQPEAGYFVWRYLPESKKVQLTPVTIGGVTNNGIEIVSGIDSGDQIVVAGVHELHDNQRVRAWVKERGL